MSDDALFFCAFQKIFGTLERNNVKEGINMPRIAVVGAGLTGLYTAWRLQERGDEVTIFEARDRIGGRVLTKTVTLKDQSYAFDLGPTWY